MGAVLLGCPLIFVKGVNMLTLTEKEKVHQMRLDGMSYSKIATYIGISENTIKSFCRRNNLGAEPKNKPRTIEKCVVCKQCGKPLNQCTKGQPKKFCSDECRRIWWKVNDNLLNRKAFYNLICTGCGKGFISYGNKNRKFCGHSCFVNFKLTL